MPASSQDRVSGATRNMETPRGSLGPALRRPLPCSLEAILASSSARSLTERCSSRDRSMRSSRVACRSYGVTSRRLLRRRFATADG